MNGPEVREGPQKHLRIRYEREESDVSVVKVSVLLVAVVLMVIGGVVAVKALGTLVGFW